MPCLASRVAYGQEVTPERLAMIDQAEQYLRRCGLRDVRVRYHGGDLARVEIPREELSRMFDPAFPRRPGRATARTGFQVRNGRSGGAALRQPESGGARRIAAALARLDCLFRIDSCRARPRPKSGRLLAVDYYRSVAIAAESPHTGGTFAVG